MEEEEAQPQQFLGESDWQRPRKCSPSQLRASLATTPNRTVWTAGLEKLFHLAEDTSTVRPRPPGWEPNRGAGESILIQARGSKAYEGVDAEWVVGCTSPTLEAWLDAVPIATFMELQQCEYDGYLAQFPELAALDFSSVSPSDFMRYMPPGMLMDILRRQRENAA